MSGNPKRGIALIINNEYWKNDLKGQWTRKGSKHDVKEFTSIVQDWKYEVIEKFNLTAEEMKAAVKGVADKAKKGHDSFICCIMSHGNYMGIEGVDYDSKDHSKCDHDSGLCEWVVTVNKLARLVSPENCKNLAYKPKIFIIQACRGDEVPVVTRQQANRKERRSSLDRLKSFWAKLVCKHIPPIPPYMDYLYAYATVPTTKSMREPAVGTVFIQTLCEVFKEHASRLSLYEMLLLVNDKMATEDRTKAGTDYRQMGEIISTLRKKVYFSS